MLEIIVILLGSFLFVFLLFAFVSYKKVKSNSVLVVWGMGAGARGKKIKTGGGVFVIPFFQSSKTLSLEPFVVDIPLEKALSKNNIRVNTPSTFTIAIGNSSETLENAAERLLDLEECDLKEQASDVIFGQLRTVIAGLTIEEINADRDLFEEKVTSTVATELIKLGLILINVNIKDVTDESGYIEAIGKKAAAEAIFQANIDVATETKKGAIGTAAAEKEQLISVAELRAERDIGTAAAEKERNVRVAQYSAEQAKGEYEAEAVQAEATKELQVKKAQYKEESEVAQANAQIRINEKLKNEALTALRAEEVVKIEAQKEKIELEAEAEKVRIVKLAEAEAEAIRLKFEAEAKGIETVLNAKAKGYSELVKASGSANDAQGLLVTEKLEELTKIQTEAIKNLTIDKVTVWDSGNGDGQQGLSNFVKNFATMLPAASEVVNIVGYKLPEFLGAYKNEEKKPEVKEEESK